MAAPHALARLTHRYKEVVESLEAHAEKLADRVEKLGARGEDTLVRHEQFLDQIGSGLTEMEGYIAQLSNGGPPLEDTKPQYTLSAPDRNGVSVNKDAKDPAHVDHNGVAPNKG